ncbi:TolC family protein [Anaerosporomusa subterranea]|uniref:TolC family protein n=1 Tax=Anaerosporomusa subterranea TaxID=1794912 RepID=UPI00082497D1|nr:TolC family protein [Anaerosporomusa subterranea]
MITKILKRKIAVFAAGLMLINQASLFAAPLELTLSDSIAIALKENASITIAQADKERSEWGVNEAQTGKLPTLSLGSSYNWAESQAGSDGSLNNSLRMNWQLYNGGRTDRQVEQAKEGVLVSELGIQKAKQQLKLDVTTAYFNVLQAQNMVNVNQETVNNFKQHLQIVEEKFKVGVVAKSDVLRSEVELANAEQNLIKSENGYDVAVATLLNIMDRTSETEVVLKDDFGYEKSTISLDESLVLARKNRPDITQSEANVRIAEQGVAIAESGNSPTVSLSASKGWNDVVPDNGNWSAGVSANWNIFDAGLTKSKVRQADASLVKAKEQAKQVSDSVALEVRQAYLNMLEGEKRIQTTDVASQKAQEDMFIAQEKYRAGVGTNLDVIDAQLALTQARTNRIQALYDFNVSKAKLDKAVGNMVQ